MCPTYVSAEKNKKTSMSNSTTNTQEQLRISSSQVDQLERENKRLVEQLKEVIKMNTHWQRYDSQREEYVLKLTRTNQELQDKVSDLQQQLDDINIGKEAAAIKDDKPQMKKLQQTAEGDEGGELKALRKEEELTLLTDCVAKLKDRIAELEVGRESRKKDDDDQLFLLREQVNVCVEDFKQERKDRERIHGENERLRERLADTEERIKEREEQIFVYEEQIKELQGHNLRHPVPKYGAVKGYDEPCCYPEDRPHRHRAPALTRNTHHHHQPMYFGDDLPDLPSDVEIDGLPDALQDETDSVSTVTAEISDITNAPKKDADDGKGESFQCPRCLASFELDRYNDLMKHIDKCVQ